MASARVLLGWQMLSPDMFMFTNVCAMIMLSILKEYPKAIEETKIFMQQILRQIISQYLYPFFFSLPSHMAMVIKLKGGLTK